MISHSAPARPVIHAEQALLQAILDGSYPPGSLLPAERELAARLGVTRPTLREALQRLARDGWLSIRQGKPTQVNDVWREGGLSILSALAQHAQHLPPNFVISLLEVRLALAPAYTGAAAAQAPDAVLGLLAGRPAPEEPPARYAAFDWQLHRGLALASANPLYPLILNGFASFYEQMALRYFAPPEARARSLAFYERLEQAVRAGDAAAAAELSRAVMQTSIELWRALATND